MPLPKTTIEQDLPVRAQQGDENALAALIARMMPAIRSGAAACTAPGLDFEDAVQEGLIGLFHAVRGFDAASGETFTAYAAASIRPAQQDARKAALRKKHAPLNSYISFYSGSYPEEEKERMLLDTMATVRTESPEDAFISKESTERILGSIETLLTPLEKQVLELFMDGYSYQQIAAVLGRSTKAVDNALQRIKRKLERNLQDDQGG